MGLMGLMGLQLSAVARKSGPWIPRWDFRPGRWLNANLETQASMAVYGSNWAESMGLHDSCMIHSMIHECCFTCQIVDGFLLLPFVADCSSRLFTVSARSAIWMAFYRPQASQSSSKTLTSGRLGPWHTLNFDDFDIFWWNSAMLPMCFPCAPHVLPFQAQGAQTGRCSGSACKATML